MSDEKVRVGLVGLGHNGLGHISAHLRCGKSVVAALCDRNPERLAAAGERFGVSRLYRDAEICEADDIDAISIHTGDTDHCEPFTRAVRAGRHVLVEKPLANTESDVTAMVDAARAAPAGLKIQVGYILRFNPVFEQVRRLAEDGALGRIYYLEADYIHNLLYQRRQTDPVTGTNWYLDQERPMVGGGSHALDLLRWICGQEVVAAAGYANHVAFPEMASDDCQVALYRFADGTVAKVAALYAPRMGMAPYYNLRAYGTRGTVDRNQVALAADDEDVHPDFGPIDAAEVAGHPYDPEVEDWLDAIVDDRPTRTGLCDGANSTLATLRACQAIDEGREIDVPVLGL